jgi:hypothetical protein
MFNILTFLGGGCLRAWLLFDLFWSSNMTLHTLEAWRHLRTKELGNMLTTTEDLQSSRQTPEDTRDDRHPGKKANPSN